MLTVRFYYCHFSVFPYLLCPILFSTHTLHVPYWLHVDIAGKSDGNGEYDSSLDPGRCDQQTSGLSSTTRVTKDDLRNGHIISLLPSINDNEIVFPCLIQNKFLQIKPTKHRNSREILAPLFHFNFFFSVSTFSHISFIFYSSFFLHQFCTFSPSCKILVT